MISDSISKEIAQAMKNRDELRLSTLRMLSSALNYEKIAKQHGLSYEEEIVVVRREMNNLEKIYDAFKIDYGFKASDYWCKNNLNKGS